VLPALLLNYAGQVALLDDPAMEGNPFFRLAPSWSIYPLVGLATVATIIASQAIITGSFSLTRQAMQFGWFPGVRFRQTSSEEYTMDSATIPPVETMPAAEYRHKSGAEWDLE
jgi:KUP system potassium uptake protein